MMEEKKGTWGGRREGAGRKPQAEPVRSWQVRVTERERELLSKALKAMRENPTAPIQIGPYKIKIS